MLQRSGDIGAVALLCGGGSRRMGSDKAMIVFEGMALIERQANNIRQTLPEVPILICAGNHRFAALGNEDVNYVQDTEQDAGPLGGLSAALASAKYVETRASHVLALPVDSLLLPSEVITALLSVACHPEGAVVLKSHRLHPLHGLFPLSAADAMGRYITSGRRNVMPFLETLDWREACVPADWEPCLNFNSPEEYASACRAFPNLSDL